MEEFISPVPNPNNPIEAAGFLFLEAFFKNLNLIDQRYQSLLVLSILMTGWFFKSYRSNEAVEGRDPWKTLPYDWRNCTGFPWRIYGGLLGLNLKPSERHKARFVGTGMHGGAICIHGEVASVSREMEIDDLNEENWKILHDLIYKYCKYFGLDADKILELEFKKIASSHRPYGSLYVH